MVAGEIVLPTYSFKIIVLAGCDPYFRYENRKHHSIREVETVELYVLLHFDSMLVECV